MAGLRARAADVLERAGLSTVAFDLYQKLAALRAPSAPGLPGLPPAYLRVITAGTANPVVFSGVGGNVTREVLALAERHGVELTANDAVLDFGCGCGRVAGPLGASTPARLFGCDVNPRLIAWCKANLPGDYHVTRPSPPLPYADGVFALVYALSVFTHLHDDNARAWLAELARVTRPGGLAVLTFFGEDVAADPAFRAELVEGGFLVRREGVEGSNLMCGYFSQAGFAEHAAPGWRPAAFIPAADNATSQTLAILRRA